MHIHHIKKLLKENIIIKENSDVFLGFISNETSEYYKFYKKYYFIKKIINSKLLDFIEKETLPHCIFLFGSFGKGEYNNESDVDLFVESGKYDLDLKKYEDILGHKINILYGTNLNKLNHELQNNIINGIKLRGYLKVR